MDAMTRGQVARKAHVNIETLRFYERRGVIPHPPRRESGYRAYPPETVQTVRFIKRAQQLGFTLGEIRELLALSRVAGNRCETAQRLARDKLAVIRQKIEDLRGVESALVRLLSVCRRPRPGRELTCPIIDSLVDGEEQ